VSVSSGNEWGGWVESAAKVLVLMRILALITARGGSKRVPGKNMRLLGGKPLIAWSINIAKNIPEVFDILVSTDDNAIAEVAKNGGAMVPWLRPTELATDTASSIDVCLHALKWYEGENGKVDGLMLLQPTSPFRSRDSVLLGIELFRLHQFHPVIGVSTAESHPMWCFKIEEGTMHPFVEGVDMSMRSQDLPPAYVVNGSFYLIAPNDLRRLKSFYSENMVPLVVDAPEESLDIDTEWDWKLAEAILQIP
jgi:CMP-N,N'-diacetyllegionaminic acid synthase